MFREESTSWYYAYYKLKEYKYVNFNAFKQVKQMSLMTYYKTLNLIDAPLDVYFKLSQLGDDFLLATSGISSQNKVIQK